jgi:hypothetical protein
VVEPWEGRTSTVGLLGTTYPQIPRVNSTQETWEDPLSLGAGDLGCIVKPHLKKPKWKLFLDAKIIVLDVLLSCV